MNRGHSHHRVAAGLVPYLIFTVLWRLYDLCVSLVISPGHLHRFPSVTLSRTAFHILCRHLWETWRRKLSVHLSPAAQEVFLQATRVMCFAVSLWGFRGFLPTDICLKTRGPPKRTRVFLVAFPCGFSFKGGTGTPATAPNKWCRYLTENFALRHLIEAYESQLSDPRTGQAEATSRV